MQKTQFFMNFLHLWNCTVGKNLVPVHFSNKHWANSDPISKLIPTLLFAIFILSIFAKFCQNDTFPKSIDIYTSLLTFTTLDQINTHLQLQIRTVILTWATVKFLSFQERLFSFNYVNFQLRQELVPPFSHSPLSSPSLMSTSYFK